MVSIKILVVDDKQENLIAMEAAFHGSGYELYNATSGKEALALAKTHQFACILLDVQMPVLNGFETAEALRKIPNSEFTPIIFVTAIHRSNEYEELGYNAGAVDYLFKPINVSNLRAKVSIFVKLFLQSEEIKKKNILLEKAIDQSRENEELRLALQSRDEFLMMASHELKTPMTPLYLQMQTFIHLFESGAVNNVEHEKLLRMLGTSQGQIERLSRLINELVDVSKVSTNKLELNPSVMSLASLAEKVLTDFEAEIKKAGSTITLDIKDRAMGNWDSFRIEQVIINLVTNALKYGLDKPIHIEVGLREEKCAYFKITDNGIGIPEQDHFRIFRRFERAVSGNNFSGLGLGLYISKQIILLHRGRIWVDTAINGGSIFTFELPVE